MNRTMKIVLLGCGGLLLLCGGVVTALLVWAAGFISTSPMPIERVSYRPDEATALRERLEAEREAARREGQNLEVELSERELNIIVLEGLDEYEEQVRKGSAELRDLRLRLDADRLAGQLVIYYPRQQAYLNVDLKARVEIEAGILRIDLESCRVGERDLPLGEELAAKLEDELRDEIVRRGLKRLRVQDGRLRIELRADEP